MNMNSQRSTLEYRAAEYVGREDMPRHSVKLSPHAVLVVWNDPNVSALIYDESHGGRRGVRGTTFMLTPTRRRLLAALFEESS